MAITRTLASFPNSRIKPRDARTSGNTDIQTIGAGLTVLVSAANPNRTDFTIRNLDSVNSVYYGYEPTIDGTPAGEGFELKAGEAKDLFGVQPIYVHNPTGSAINIVTDEGSG